MDYNTAVFDLNMDGSHNMASFINRCKRVFDDINFYNYSEDGWSFLICSDRPFTKENRQRSFENIFNLRRSLDIFTNGMHIENNNIMVMDELDSDVTCHLKSLSVVNKRAYGIDMNGDYYNLQFASGYNDYHLIKLVSLIPETYWYNQITDFVNESVSVMGREMRTDTIKNKLNGDEFMYAIDTDINTYHDTIREDILKAIQIVSTGYMHEFYSINFKEIKETLELNGFKLVTLSKDYVQIEDEVRNTYKFLHGVYDDSKQ